MGFGSETGWDLDTVESAVDVEDSDVVAVVEGDNHAGGSSSGSGSD